MVELDNYGQPLNPYFNKARNNAKALSSLRGILQGITADRQLNEAEILFLYGWVEENTVIGGDFVDIYEDITRILKDYIITSEEIEDLTQVIDDCLEYGSRFEDINSRINQFIGFLKGISADGKILESEFNKLVSHLKSDSDITSKFPVNIIVEEVEEILFDNKASSSELVALHELITKITGINFTENGDVTGSSISLFDKTIKTNLRGKTVCFTGKFSSGTRQEVETRAAESGMKIHKAVRRDTDFVIIGASGNRDWILSSLGRKIEEAYEFKCKGASIFITTENRWQEAMAVKIALQGATPPKSGNREVVD